VDLAALETVIEEIADSVRAISPDQRHAPTPCSEWNLTALVDHITGGNWFTVAVLAGERAEEAMTIAMKRFGGRSATGEEALRSLTEQLIAFRRTEVLDRTWNHAVGDASGRTILPLRLHDLIVHSWDIQEALRPEASVPDDLVRWGLGELRDAGSSTAQHFGLVDEPAAQSATEDWITYLQVFGRAAARGRQPSERR
jgi:uncharacterized protein (TIGR03086 family)